MPGLRSHRNHAFGAANPHDMTCTSALTLLSPDHTRAHNDRSSMQALRRRGDQTPPPFFNHGDGRWMCISHDHTGTPIDWQRTRTTQQHLSITVQTAPRRARRPCDSLTPMYPFKSPVPKHTDHCAQAVPRLTNTHISLASCSLDNGRHSAGFQQPHPREVQRSA